MCSRLDQNSWRIKSTVQVHAAYEEPKTPDLYSRRAAPSRAGFMALRHQIKNKSDSIPNCWEKWRKIKEYAWKGKSFRSFSECDLKNKKKHYRNQIKLNLTLIIWVIRVFFLKIIIFSRLSSLIWDTLGLQWDDDWGGLSHVIAAVLEASLLGKAIKPIVWAPHSPAASTSH